MKKITLLFLVVLFTLPMVSQSKSNAKSQVKEVGKALLPKELKYNKKNLMLNGSGIRHKYFFNIYTIGLYLNKKSSDAKHIMEADENMSVRFESTSKLLSKEKLENAFRDGFERSTNGNTGKIRPRIEKFLDLMAQDPGLGKVYDVFYEKGVGCTVYYEGEKQGVVKGLDFKTALFGVWLSDSPVNKRLRKELLGLK